MLGSLPTELTINGKTYPIRTDYRDVLRIISAFSAKDLDDREKIVVCMRQLYRNVWDIPAEDMPAAYEAALRFIEYFPDDGKKSPRTVNWEKDETLIFPAINAAAGTEVRALKYLHWWTFLGYFQMVDRESTWGAVLTVRQKQARHKKLESWEQEFYNSNRSLCEIDTPEDRKKRQDDAILRMQRELMALSGGTT